jgi:hypothetical protein
MSETVLDEAVQRAGVLLSDVRDAEETPTRGAIQTA